MRARQLSFLPSMKVSTALHHGGEINEGKRKVRRPFDPKRPLHVVLRSSYAKEEWSMLRPAHEDRIKREVERIAKRYHVRVYQYVNVGNHLHLLVQAKRKVDFQAFLRVLTGAIAFLVTGTRKGKKIGFRGFWDRLAYSRVVTWGREFDALKVYFIKNLFESKGFWNRKREPHLKFMWVSMKEAGIGPSK